MSRFRVLLITFLMVSFVLPAALGDATPAPAGPSAPQPEADYPNGWTHRPVMEFLTSLSCTFCMNYADPAISKLWVETRDDPEVPWLFLAFHQTNGGKGDDPFVTEESQDRYDHYSPVGTPDAEFDGGYIQEGGGGDTNYEDYIQDFDDCGNRDVKPTELKVWQEFKGDKFTVRANLTYLGDPDFIPIVDGLQDELDPSLYIFMVEDDILVYSSILDQDVITHNVFRGYGLEDEQPGPLAAGETYSVVVDWEIPPDATVPINPANVFALVVAYDLDDDSSRSNSNPKAGLPRAINAASPRSTAYDEQNAPPEIASYEENYGDEGAEVMAYFDDEDGIGSAYVVYNYNNATHNGTWEVLEMRIEGEEICDENGVCYAYGDATGTVVIPYDGDQPIWYRTVFVDGNLTHNTTAARVFTGGVSPLILEEERAPVLLLAGAGMAVAAGAFLYWARKPYQG